MKRTISLCVCLILLWNLVIPVFAEDTVEPIFEVTAESFDAISFARDVYASLDSDSREAFIYEISQDAELLEFHRMNIDPTFSDVVITIPPHWMQR